MTTPTTNVSPVINHDLLYRYVAASIGSSSQPGTATPTSVSGVWMVSKDSADDVKKLWMAYLALFPEDQRQHFNCAACQRWFERYANIQVVGFEDGKITRKSLCWGPWQDQGGLSDHERAMAASMRELVLQSTPSRIVFERKLMPLARAPGKQKFEHFFSVTASPKVPSFEILKTNDQYLANKEALTKFLTSELQADSVTQARSLFRLNPLYAGYTTHAHRIKQVATALDNLSALTGVDRGIYLSLLALTELTTVRSGLVGAFLLKLQESGMDAAKSLFKEMVNPQQYRQPSALPHSQQVEQAEGIIAELGLRDSLLFDVARIDDPELPVIRRYQKQTQVPTPGVFGNLKTSDQKSKTEVSMIDVGDLSFATAWENYFSKATEVESDINIRATASYGIVGVQQNRNAPPILSYDDPNRRCPFTVLIFDQRLPGTMAGLKPRMNIEGILKDPSDHSAGALWCFIVTVDETSPITVGNLLSTQVRSELHEYWRVLHHFNKDRQQQITPGSALLIPIPRVLGTSWQTSSPMSRFYATLLDGTKVTFRVLTA